jgi:hypothetical protein
VIMKTAPEPRRLRLVVDLVVDDDIWEERQQEGNTDKFLVTEVRKTLRIDGGPLCHDVEIQTVELL